MLPNTLNEETGTAKQRVINFELIAAIVLAIMALGCFTSQMLTINEKTTKLEAALFNILQFLLTVGFTWFSSRAISKGEFEANLKKFAISAYRRISDIEQIVQRLQSKITRMQVNRKSDDGHDLEVILSIVDDTAQIVSSSIADWGDVIGDELITLEKIKRLEKEKQEIQTELPSTEPGDDKIKQLDTKIDSLLSLLPARLQLESRRDDLNTQKKALAIAKFLNEKHSVDNGLELLIQSGGHYGKLIKSSSDVNSRKPLSLKIIPGKAIDIFDKHDMLIGRVLNDTPGTYDLFRKGLELCYGKNILSVEFIGLTESFNKGDSEYSSFRVRVLTPPKLEDDKAK